MGMFHPEIIPERLSQECDLDLITTAPSMVYRLHIARIRATIWLQRSATVE